MDRIEQEQRLFAAGDEGPSSSRAIAKSLHDGIMQDLTVAGFRLRALEQTAPDGLRSEIGALAAWLSERQAVLRDFVSALIGLDPPDDGLNAKVGALLPRCRVVWEIDPATTIAGSPSLISALLLLTGALASFAAPQVVWIAKPAANRLSLTHDGSPLESRSKASAGVRRALDELGATLRIVRRGGVETLTIVQVSRR